MLTASLDPPFAVTTNTRVPGVLCVIESSRRLRTCVKTLFSRAAGASARNLASKWALIAAAGSGACGTAPSSQRACRPTGVPGKLAVELGAAGLAAGFGGESQAAPSVQAAATAMAVAAPARRRPVVLAEALPFM